MANAILEALRRHAERAPDAIALRDDRRQLTYGELWDATTGVSSSLRDVGVKVAGVRGENSIEWIIADLATWHAGTVAVPMPSFFSPAQITHVVKTTGMRHVIECGPVSSPTPGADRLASPLADIRLSSLSRDGQQIVIAPNVAKITFTSGTTGTPRGVCLSTSTLEATVKALASRIHEAPGMVESLQAHFTLLPLSTLLENVAGVYVPLALGRSITTLPGPTIGLHGSSGLDVRLLVSALQIAQPASLIVLPQILRALVSASRHGLRLPSSLRFVAVGGASTPPALLRQAHELAIPVYEGYGLSECASVVALNAPGANRPGSVGRVLDHVRVRIVDGAIEVAGNAFSGYLGGSTQPSGSWLDTGDLGHLDADGYLHVTGRRKNLLISSFGRNISPEWIEAELLLCPSIAQAMVIGDGQPFLGAIIVPRSGAEIEEVAREVAHANTDLPDYARLRRFIVADGPFSSGNDSLTDNGRLKRDVISAKHAEAIAALYATTANANGTGLVHDLL